MMFFEGYIGEPPTVTVCSFCCAKLGGAATAARASAATAAAVGRAMRESFMWVLRTGSGVGARRACGWRPEIRRATGLDATAKVLRPAVTGSCRQPMAREDGA